VCRHIDIASTKTLIYSMPTYTIQCTLYSIQHTLHQYTLHSIPYPGGTRFQSHLHIDSLGTPKLPGITTIPPYHHTTTKPPPCHLTHLNLGVPGTWCQVPWILVPGGKLANYLRARGHFTLTLGSGMLPETPIYHQTWHPVAAPRHQES